MGLLDVFTGKLAKRQLALTRLAYAVLNEEIPESELYWSAFVRSAGSAKIASFLKDGRQRFRIMGINFGDEPLFDSIAAGTRYMGDDEQLYLARMTDRLFQKGDAAVLAIADRIKSRCNLA